jgi:hypothetical protein
MVWLNLSPILMGRRGVISSFKLFYLSSLHVEKGGKESAPCALNMYCTYVLYYIAPTRICGKLVGDRKRKSNAGSMPPPPPQQADPPPPADPPASTLTPPPLCAQHNGAQADQMLRILPRSRTRFWCVGLWRALSQDLKFSRL